MIFFNGVSSDDVGIVVEHYPNRFIPDRRQEFIQIPGKAGDILNDIDGQWNNYVQPYDIYVSAEKPRLPKIARRVVEWLSPKGYCRLEDSYEPDLFREAVFQGPLEIENIVNRFGRATIEFNCKPQRFLRTGEQSIPCSNGMTLVNPTAYEAKPIISAVGTGNCQIIINEVAISIQGLTAITIDCETMNAYYESLNMNGIISARQFPVLSSGENVIETTGDVQSLEIIPRWWVL